jgi:hypothetical protein
MTTENIVSINPMKTTFFQRDEAP